MRAALALFLLAAAPGCYFMPIEARFEGPGPGCAGDPETANSDSVCDLGRPIMRGSSETLSFRFDGRVEMLGAESSDGRVLELETPVCVACGGDVSVWTVVAHAREQGAADVILKEESGGQIGRALLSVQAARRLVLTFGASHVGDGERSIITSGAPVPFRVDALGRDDVRLRASSGIVSTISPPEAAGFQRRAFDALTPTMTGPGYSSSLLGQMPGAAQIAVEAPDLSATFDLQIE